MKPVSVIAGLTGSFGSGKSTAARMFAELGAQVIDADRLAHEALDPSSPVAGALRSEFAEAFSEGDGFNRRRLAVMIFNDAARRGRLEAIVHPYVFRRMEEEIDRASAELIVLEVPLLFETGFDARCDKTIYVDAAADVIAARLDRKGFSAAEIELRNAAQMPPQEKAARADFKICNNGTLDQTREEVRRIFHRLLTDRKGAK